MLLSLPNAKLQSAITSDYHMASGVVVVVVMVVIVVLVVVVGMVIVVVAVVVVVMVVVVVIVVVVVRLRELKVQMTVGVRNPPRAALL